MKILPKWWNDRFLLLEGVVGTALTVAVAVAFEKYGALTLMPQSLVTDRSAIYAAIASILGSLLGFVIATVPIIVLFTSQPRLRLLRATKEYRTMWRVFISAIRWLGGATLLALFALTFDRGVPWGRLSFYLFLLFAVIAILRVTRCVWVLEKLVEVVGKPEA